MTPPIFYDGYEGLIRVLLTAPVLYVAVIAFVRVAGKRSISQMNNFDWVVTVALGSIVASGIMLKDVSVAETVLAISLLLFLQWLLTKLSFSSGPVNRLVKAQPALLFAQGEFLHEALRGERVTEAEVRAAVRNQGFSSLEDVGWVVLETDATISVIPRADLSQSEALLSDVSESGVRRP